MSKMILKDKITQLKKGYPTVSDKYNVAGGVLQAGATPVPFGELVKYGSTAGYYEAAAGAAAVGEIAGPVLATNVKLTGIWPDDGSTTPSVQPKEAFNLLLDGYIALELDSGYTLAQVAAGKKLAVILATGKLTTFDKVAAGIVEMPGYYFTGVTHDGLAEVEVRR